jgi:hypothetical protein
MYQDGREGKFIKDVSRPLDDSLATQRLGDKDESEEVITPVRKPHSITPSTPRKTSRVLKNSGARLDPVENRSNAAYHSFSTPCQATINKQSGNSFCFAASISRLTVLIFNQRQRWRGIASVPTD